MKRVLQVLFTASFVLGASSSLLEAQQLPDAGRERVVVYRTAEDPAVPAVPAGCPHVNPNVRLGATVWSFQMSANDGEVVNEKGRQIGTASACGLITSPLVPGATVPFFVEFNVEEGIYVADGTCTVVTNNVPTPGLILAGCNLRLQNAPAGFAGGTATSNSVFNPARLAGFNTGSFWTLRFVR